MQVIEYNHLTDQKEIYEGSDRDVKAGIFKNHPYLLSKLGWESSIEDIVKALDRNQLYSATISSVQLIKTEVNSDNPQLFNKDTYLEVLRVACEFLSGIKVDPLKIRQALIEYDGDEKAAMLDVHNVVPSKENLDALDAVLRASLSKSEDTDRVIEFKEITPFNESGTDFAEKVIKANKSQNIKEIELKGKHSEGTLLAKDPETFETIILKPGNGKQNPALGELQNPASQSRRESCFYACADLFDIKEFLPECRLLYLDGKEYAAIQFLPKVWKNGNDIKSEDPNLARRILSPYLVIGTIHKFAAVDYILGNPDRHSGNVMFSGPNIKLIDHGSAFAGSRFNPPIDKHSFVPYYLRVFTSSFKKLTEHEKLLKLPRINVHVQEEVLEWLNKINTELLSKIMFQYDIDPKASIDRLNKLKYLASIQPVDLAINGAWVLV